MNTKVAFSLDAVCYSAATIALLAYEQNVIAALVCGFGIVYMYRAYQRIKQMKALAKILTDQVMQSHNELMADTLKEPLSKKEEEIEEDLFDEFTKDLPESFLDHITRLEDKDKKGE